jgi:hypothetical protein
MVRLGQLSESFAVPGSRSGDQVGCHHSTLASGLSLLRNTTVDVGRTANWAVGGRPVSRRHAVNTSDNRTREAKVKV